MLKKKIIFLLLITFATALYSCERGEEVSCTDDARMLPSGMTIPSHQSHAISGDTLVILNIGGAGEIYRLDTNEKIASFTLPYHSHTPPHCNTACFGEKFGKDSVLPLLYVSQWDGDGGCLVYDFIFSCENLIPVLVQYINAEGCNCKTYGSKLGDWVINVQDSSIYAVKYFTNSSTDANGNSIRISKFALPTSDNNTVTYTEADIRENFELPFMAMMQDKCISGNKFYMACGAGNNTHPSYLSVISLENYGVEQICLNSYKMEPEGLDVKDGHLVISFNGSAQLFNIDKNNL